VKVNDDVPYSVHVVDQAGHGLANVQVTFAVTANTQVTGTLSASVAVTDANGNAGVTYHVASGTAGQKLEVQASAYGLGTALFNSSITTSLSEELP
jgi:hypothetical protein